MASTFYVTAQTEDVQEALKETSLSIPRISRKFLTIIGQKTSAVVKTGIRQTYSPPSKYYKRTGDFLRAWTYHARKDGSQVAVYPKVIYTTSDGQRKNRQWAAGLSSILNYGTKDGRIMIGYPILSAQALASSKSTAIPLSGIGISSFSIM